MIEIAIACLVATAAALRPAPALALRRPLDRVDTRKSTVLAQNGWITGVDEASGLTYYYNEQTGQLQWDPPQAAMGLQGSGAQILWRLVPTAGVYSEFIVCNGKELVLGCADMIEQVPTVSQVQCLIQVAADGSATLVSLGERPTGLRVRRGAPAFGLRKKARHVLADGNEIALDGVSMTGLYTCQAEMADAVIPEQEGDQQQGDWVTGVDEASGQTYYYNEQTGHSQWEPP